MRKSKMQSAFYYRKPQVMSSDERLDFNYWQPKYESLIQILSSKKFPNKELDMLVRTPIISGKTPENYVFPMKGVPFIGARNIRNGKVDLANTTYIDDYIHEGILQSSKIAAGDILVTMAGSIGRTAIYVDKTKEANISQAVARLQPNVEEVNPQYLVYYLNSYFGQVQFERDRHDVNQPNINTTEMGKIKVLLPTKRTDQDQIASQMQDVENNTSLQATILNQVLEEARNIIPAELSLRLPSAEYEYYSQPSGSLGERLDFIWKRPVTEMIKQYLVSKGAVPLDGLIEKNIEYGVNAYGTEKGKIPFINVENLSLDGVIRSGSIRYLNAAPEPKILKENEILVSRSRTVGICSLVTKKEVGYTYGSYILRLRVKSGSKLDPQFLVSFMNSEIGQAQIIYLQTGSREVTQGGGNNINPDQLRQMLVVLPSSPEQQSMIVMKTRRLREQKEVEQAKLDEMMSLFGHYFENIFSM